MSSSPDSGPNGSRDDLSPSEQFFRATNIDSEYDTAGHQSLPLRTTQNFATYQSGSSLYWSNSVRHDQSTIETQRTYHTAHIGSSGIYDPAPGSGSGSILPHQYYQAQQVVGSTSGWSYETNGYGSPGEYNNSLYAQEETLSIDSSQENSAHLDWFGHQDESDIEDVDMQQSASFLESQGAPWDVEGAGDVDSQTFERTVHYNAAQQLKEAVSASMSGINSPAEAPAGLATISDDSSPEYSDPNTRDDASISENERPRGGRRPGMNLQAETLKHVRALRALGACLRCKVLRVKCSEGTPCQTCSSTKGPKWTGRTGCFRSFKGVGETLIPDLLANRLGPDKFYNFMTENGTTYPSTRLYIRMPLNFGFGKNFEGMLGMEFISRTNETRLSRFVDLASQEGAQPGYEHSLPLIPTYEHQNETMKLLLEWLKKTVVNEHSMNQWRAQVFSRDSDLWMSDLLAKIWSYSYYCCWHERGSASHANDDVLTAAWMTAMVATMLSIQVIVPEPEKRIILSQLQFPLPEYKRPEVNSSRPINKVVKYLLVTIYKKLVPDVMSAFDKFVQDNRVIDERSWAHMYCVSVLLLTAISQVQISLIEFHILAQQDNRAQWDETFEALEKLEGAYKNVTLVFRWKYSRAIQLARGRERPQPPVSLDGSGIIHDQHVRTLLRGIRKIRQDYRDDVSQRQGEDLHTHMGMNDQWPNRFSTINSQRLLAFFFRTMYPRRQDGLSV